MRASKETKLENLPFVIDSIDRVPGAWNVGGNTSAEVEKMESFTVAFAENEDDGFEDKNAHQNNASHARKNLTLPMRRLVSLEMMMTTTIQRRSKK